MDQLFNDKEETREEMDAALDSDSSQIAQISEDVRPPDCLPEQKFGEQLKQLEGIVTQLESGQLDLEDSMKTYGEGVQLIHALQEKLSDAEQKLSVMMDEITPTEE